MYGPGWFPHWGIFMPIFMIAMVFICFFFLSRFNTNHQNTSEKKDGAMEILRKRFANGEITETEYATMRDALREQ